MLLETSRMNRPPDSASAARDWTAMELEPGQVASPGTLEALAAGELAAVVLRGRVSTPDAAEWSEIVKRERGRRARTHSYPNGALTTIGSFLMKMRDRPEEYFTDAGATEALFAAAAAGDPGRALRRAVRRGLGIETLEPAKDPQGRGFLPAVVRLHDPGVSNPLHSDLTRRDLVEHPAFAAVGAMDLQLSVVLCLQGCEGGELLVYRRPWGPEHERFKIRDGLGYDAAVISGVDVWSFQPRATDIYIFHGRNFHEITEVRGDHSRITLGCFIGWPNLSRKTAVAWA